MENRTSITKKNVVLIAAVVTALAAATTPAYANHGYTHMPYQCGNQIISIGPSFPTTCTYDPYFGEYWTDVVNDAVTPDPEPTGEPTPDPTSTPTPEPTKPGRGPKDKNE